MIVKQVEPKLALLILNNSAEQVHTRPPYVRRNRHEYEWYVFYDLKAGHRGLIAYCPQADHTLVVSSPTTGFVEADNIIKSKVKGIK